MKDRAQTLGLELALLDQIHDRNDEGEGEGRVTQNRQARMYAEPAALEHRVEFFDLTREDESRGHENDHKRKHERAERRDLEAEFHDEKYEHDAHAEKIGRLEKARYRDAS